MVSRYGWAAVYLPRMSSDPSPFPRFRLIGRGRRP